MSELDLLKQPESKWVTKRQLAAHFGCDVRTIGNWMRRRILPFVKIRGVLRFDLLNCEQALAQFRSKTLLERGQGPSATSPAKPAAPPPLAPPQPVHPESTVLQGVFGSPAEVPLALKEVLSRGEMAGVAALKEGRWILVLVPSKG